MSNLDQVASKHLFSDPTHEGSIPKIQYQNTPKNNALSVDVSKSFTAGLFDTNKNSHTHSSHSRVHLFNHTIISNFSP